MIFVTVGHDKAADLGLLVFEVGDVGDREIDARNSFVGEAHAAVDDEDVIVGLVDVHIIVDVGGATEGDDFNGLSIHTRSSVTLLVLADMYDVREFGFLDKLAISCH